MQFVQKILAYPLRKPIRFAAVVFTIGVIWVIGGWIWYHVHFYRGKAGQVAERYIQEAAGGKQIADIRRNWFGETSFYFEGSSKEVRLSYIVRYVDGSESNVSVLVKETSGTSWISDRDDR